MAVAEPGDDTAFVGSAEGELGDGEEVYDLHGEGEPALMQEADVPNCLGFAAALASELLCACRADRLDEDSDEDPDQQSGVQPIADHSSRSYDHHTGI